MFPWAHASLPLNGISITSTNFYTAYQWDKRTDTHTDDAISVAITRI